VLNNSLVRTSLPQPQDERITGDRTFCSYLLDTKPFPYSKRKFLPNSALANRTLPNHFIGVIFTSHLAAWDRSTVTTNEYEKPL
jgi:hypothetical protein